MRARFIRRTAVALAFGCGFGAAAAFAADEPANIVKYRQTFMTANSAHLTMIAAVVRGEVSWTDEIAGHAHALHQQSQNLNAHLERLFPEGTGPDDAGVETDALPVIWENWGEFEEAAENFEAESAALVEVAEGGDMAALGQQLGGFGRDACGGCHETFRQDD